MTSLRRAPRSAILPPGLQHHLSYHSWDMLSLYGEAVGIQNLGTTISFKTS